VTKLRNSLLNKFSSASMHTKMQYTALVACALLMIPAAAFADNGSTQNQASEQQSYLNAMLARTTCQANFATGFISTAISDIPNINQTVIGADSSKISTDLQTLTTDANNNDKTKFKTDLQSFWTDSKTGKHDLWSAIKIAKPTSDQRTKLKSDLGNLKSTYSSCMFTAGQQRATDLLQDYGTGIQKAQNRTSILASKGVDVTQLNQIISQAQTNLSNLAASVASATNASQLKTALQSYCQYNGCKSGTNFHFAAQSVLAAGQAQLNAIKSNANSTQYGSQISQAQTDLTNAQNTLATVGTTVYQGTQQTDVWNALHDASSIINHLWKELHGHK
jgi:hypothetical protein